MAGSTLRQIFQAEAESLYHLQLMVTISGGIIEMGHVMKNLVQAIGAAALAILIAGCQTTSTNRINSDAPYTGARGTGIVMFATQSDGSENYLSYTTGIHAALYDPRTGCVRNDPNEERDTLTVRGGNLNSSFGLLPVGTGLRWHVYELVPGDYAVYYISRIRNFGNVTTHENIQVVGSGPVLSVREGVVTYAGNFSVSKEHDRLFRFLNHSLPEAQEHLANFPNLPQEIEVVPSRTVPLRPRTMCNALLTSSNR